jgi:hypothetical protein
VYQIWVHRPDGTGKVGRAVHFEAGGEHYEAFASSSPTVTARKLSRRVDAQSLRAQWRGTGYEQTIIPRLENLPGRCLRLPDEQGNILISPEGFEALFAGTGVELEARPFASVFGREMNELAEAAAHARGCGRVLRLYHV